MQFVKNIIIKYTNVNKIKIYLYMLHHYFYNQDTERSYSEKQTENEKMVNMSNYSFETLN